MTLTTHDILCIINKSAMYFPTKWLIAAIFVHGCLGSFEDLMMFLLVKATVPIGHFYNESLTLHYGITLNNDGLSQVMSILDNLQFVGKILSLFIILPKMDSIGRKSLSIYFRAGLGLLTAFCMLSGKFFVSIESFAIGCIFLGATMPIKGGITRYYISECSPDEIRGFVTQAIPSIMSLIGIIFSALLLPQFLGNDEYWHFTLYISILIIAIFVFGAIFIPESPKFLWLQGKKSEAIKAIKAFHGNNVDTESITFGYNLERSLVHTKSNHISIWQIWNDINLRSSLILILVSALVMTFGPGQLYFLYSIILKNKFGFTNSQSVTFEFVLGLITIPSSNVLPFLYEKIGRRPLFLISVAFSLLTAVFMFLAEAIYELNDSTSNWMTFVLGILFTITMELSFSFGLMTFNILLVADLLPAPAKAATTQAMMLTTSILGIIFNFLFSFLQPFLGFSYYLPIILIQCFFFFYLYRNLPETRFKAVYQNFEEIQSRIHSRRSTLLLSKSRSSTYKYGTV